MRAHEINGMFLPRSLVVATSDGSWADPTARWKSLFPASELVRPMLYSLQLMHALNETWRNESRPEFVGKQVDGVRPGVLAPSRSLLIGELQGDAMIALDYRSGADTPSVAFLSVTGTWFEVAASFEDFWSRLSGTTQ